MSALRSQFAARRHSPSPEHWEGIEAITCTLQKMADGAAKPKFYGSGLPIGIGKTSTVAAFARELSSDPAYEDVGGVILVAEYAQIEALVEAMGLEPHQYAVRVRDGHPLNDAGLTGIRRAIYEREKAQGVTPLTWTKADVENAHRDAQWLITTQQKLDHMMRLPITKDYNEMSFFQYRGRPRQVRIWDEAIEPGLPVTVTAKQAAALLPQLHFAGQARAAEELAEWSKGLPHLRSGAVTTVPDWTECLGVDATDRERLAQLAELQEDPLAASSSR